jgi:hypothetical protein
VVRVNLGAAAVRILPEAGGLFDDLPLADLVEDDEPLPPPPPSKPETHAERLARYKREAAEKNEHARALVAKFDYAAAVAVLESYTPEQQRHRDDTLLQRATAARDRLAALDASIKPLLDRERYHHPRLPGLLAEFVALWPTHPEYAPLARELPSDEPPANLKPGDVFTLRAWIEAPEHAPGEETVLRWKAVAKRANPNT